MNSSKEFTDIDFNIECCQELNFAEEENVTGGISSLA